MKSQEVGSGLAQEMERYAFDLPVELIAQTPAAKRDDARLLYMPTGTAPQEHRVRDMDALLPDNSLLVVNDTRVFPARVRARKSSGGRVELLLIEPLSGAQSGLRYRCWARASKAIRTGPLQLEVDPNISVEVTRVDEKVVEVEFPFQSLDELYETLHRVGEVPLPPYIRRAAPEAIDRERYQTVFARSPGAVAAPTAGLHFTEDLLARIRAKGHEIVSITLHVGPGTFAPLDEAALRSGRLHAERYEVSDHVASQLRLAKAEGRPIVAVGTTALRALESAYLVNQLASGFTGSTELFVRPGFKFEVATALFTNFHLPRSSLLMLVGAFAGVERILAAYQIAIAQKFRFYSYGDAMLILPP